MSDTATNSGLTIEQKATNWETMQHIHKVAEFIHIMVYRLLKRADLHDLSKLEEPEVQAFTEFTPSLKGLTYGSPEYYAQLKSPGFLAALDHHYANNRHHPQHMKRGINDMNLVDLIEMFCDWNASGKRHADGNLRKSIEKNATRFDMSPQLVNIFENSVGLFEPEER